MTAAQLGVNAIASWEATTGLSAAARRSVGALVDLGVQVALVDYDYGAPRLASRLPERLRSLPADRRYDVELVFLNVNELHAMPEEVLRPPGTARRVIGSWFWELASLTPDLLEALRRVDEVWVASEFVAGVFRAATDKPVVVVPCVVEPVPDPGRSRADFGLLDGRVVYLFSFDAASTFARKNPLAVIEAYRLAFSAAERAEKVQLVMKTINLDAHLEGAELLRAQLAAVGGSVLDADLSDGEMAALTAACDVFVSLHRGEGFGLGAAEAMALGRAVVATWYSGTADFMTVRNSCPVGYRIVEVGDGELRLNPEARNVYRPGGLWAEPDVAEAARRMRLLYDRPELRARLGAAAASTIAERFSSRAVGEVMRRRLEQVARLRGIAGSAARRPA